MFGQWSIWTVIPFGLLAQHQHAWSPNNVWLCLVANISGLDRASDQQSLLHQARDKTLNKNISATLGVSSFLHAHRNVPNLLNYTHRRRFWHRWSCSVAVTSNLWPLQENLFCGVEVEELLFWAEYYWYKLTRPFIVVRTKLVV